MKFALDSETTGIDHYHGALPFLVTTCDENGDQLTWEWDVNPLTRTPVVVEEHLDEIQDLIDRASQLFLQNSKFDATALNRLYLKFKRRLRWPWEKIRDTLTMGHLLATGIAHDLTTMTLQYVNENVQPFEDRLKEACNAARRLARSKFPTWRIAKKGLPDMPSVKSDNKKKNKGVESEAPWKNDCWLPRAVAKALKYRADHPWWTVTREYADTDSASTMLVVQEQEKELKRRNLEKLAVPRHKVLGVLHRMEKRGVSLSFANMDKLTLDYKIESTRAAEACKTIACKMGYDLVLPKSGNNKSLLEFVFNVLKLPVLALTEGGAPSFKEEVMGLYLSKFPKGTPQHDFVWNLLSKRKRDTAVSYMDGYRRFSVPYFDNGKATALNAHWHRLHPSLNSTGTITLRCSSSNPNMQNLSKKKIDTSEGEARSNRYIFGPAPGREFWSFDASNIERRLPAFKAGEDAIIELFERPNDPPYYGSEHALVAHVLYPKLFEQCIGANGVLDGRLFKGKFPGTYDRVKRGNFAVQNGAQQRKADITYGLDGAFKRMKVRFEKQEALNQRCVDQAEEFGYIETMPDKSVDPERGYPIMCPRTSYGRIEPTKPFSYYIQGSAMWWMGMAMIRCDELLSKWNVGVLGDRFFMIMQVHDELVFDFPRGSGDEPWRTNLSKANTIRKAMEFGGDCIGVPTPVSCEYHADNYSEGLSMDDYLRAL